MAKGTTMKIVGYFACNPETLKPEWGEDCVCQDDVYDPEETGTVGRPFVFADQAEAYANARVREALEKALCIVELARESIGAGGLAENAQHERSVVEPHLDGIDDEIRYLISQENKS